MASSASSGTAPPPTARTVEVALRDTLTHPSLGVMNFLNEVVSRYPEAISFAPGRPWEDLFDVEQALGAVGRWADHHAEHSAGGRPEARHKALADLGQYGRTNGILGEVLARHLQRDEGIAVAPQAVMVTCGCQEAMAILLMGLFEPGRDVLLVSDPTYIGITGLARVLGVRVEPVASGEAGLDPEAVAAAAARVRTAGGRPRALYDIPDFNNPLGTSLPLEARHRLLEVARAEDLLLFEDSPYRMFAFDGPPLPTLKALDGQGGDGRVLYLGSFSKTLFPGLRLGFLVADQRVAGSGETLAEALSVVKSLVTVNTPPPLQAAAGALLREEGFSLERLVGEKVPFYRRNRDRMVAALEDRFTAEGLHGPGVPAERTVRWNRPGGGFFLTVELPFPFDEAAVAEAAGEHGVIVCPMSFFSLLPGRERQVRLSFSYVSPQDVDEGVARFARFVAARVARGGATEGTR